MPCFDPRDYEDPDRGRASAMAAGYSGYAYPDGTDADTPAEVVSAMSREDRGSWAAAYYADRRRRLRRMAAREVATIVIACLSALALGSLVYYLCGGVEVPR